MTAELSNSDRVNLLDFFKAVAVRDGRTAAECTLRLSKRQNCPNPKAFIEVFPVETQQFILHVSTFHICIIHHRCYSADWKQRIRILFSIFLYYFHMSMFKWENSSLITCICLCCQQEVEKSFTFWGTTEGDLVHPAECMQQLLEQVRRHRVNIDGNVCTVMVTTLVLEVISTAIYIHKHARLPFLIL